jgi:hypothetical protein
MSGTLYYMVLGPASNKSGVTAENIRNGIDGSGAAATLAGAQSVTANVSTTVQLTGLSVGSSYTVFACVYAGAENYSNVLSSNFTATYVYQDGNYPGGLSAALSASSVTANSALLYMNGTRDALLYYAVFAEDNGKPTDADIKAGRDRYGIPAEKSGSKAITANITDSAALTGLLPNKAYYVYYTVNDYYYGETYTAGPVKFTTAAAPSYTLRSVSFVGDGFSKTISAFPEKTININNVPAFVTGLTVTADYETADGNLAVISYVSDLMLYSVDSEVNDEYINVPIESGVGRDVSVSLERNKIKLTINGDVYTFVLNFAAA